MRIVLFVLLSFPAFSQFSAQEIAGWQKRAAKITITRDTWGVPHIEGKTDADAVFGMLYAQCEDDFERVERNYIAMCGRLAEAEGEKFLYHDLRMRLFQDTLAAIRAYASAPPWLKLLCESFADGVNYYIYTHPAVKPKLLHRFKPWMPILFSEGSIGGDIESVSLNEIKEFYGREPGDIPPVFNDDGIEDWEPQGSNGIAIAPAKTVGGKALLLINPHTSFYFRSELQVTSKENLNAYGAVTWGQFFIYQGFNEHCGWMHTSSEADVLDEYRETIVKKGDSLFYKFGEKLRPLQVEKISLAFRSGEAVTRKDFTVYRTHHGPVFGTRSGKWMSVKLMQDPVNALIQSYTRTKAVSLDEFNRVMKIRTNSSNNTVYADDHGNIAYWHGNFMPIRDQTFDWSQPVDGSDPATEWKGLHQPEELIQILNPGVGWIQNCNSTPFTAAGPDSPHRNKYPAYMAPDAENFRAIHAIRLLKDERGFTPQKLIAAAYDSYLPAFEKIIPSLVAALAETPGPLDGPYVFLRDWDFRFSENSVPTVLAIFWAQKLRSSVINEIPQGLDQLAVMDFLTKRTSAAQKAEAMTQTIKDLENDYGTWKITWGEVNRFQRLTGKIEPVFDDSKPSLSVPFTSSLWGSLAAFGSRRYPGTKKLYGSVGNSFVAVVEFGDRVQARTVLTGGESSDPSSAHFTDQGEMYCKAKFKNVPFYKDQLAKQTERIYNPGK